MKTSKQNRWLHAACATLLLAAMGTAQAQTYKLNLPQEDDPDTASATRDPPASAAASRRARTLSAYDRGVTPVISRNNRRKWCRAYPARSASVASEGMVSLASIISQAARMAAA